MSPLQVLLCLTVVYCMVLPSFAERPRLKKYAFLDATKSFYKFYHKRATWTEAVSNCKKDGAELFYPENEWEASHIGSLFKAYYYYIHIGISDLEESHSYKTIDGRPISQVYNKWEQGEPDSGLENQNRCLGFHVEDLTIFANDCSTQGTYICKYKPDTEDKSTTTVAPDISSLLRAIEELKGVFVNFSGRQLGFNEQQNTVLEQQAGAMEAQAQELKKLADAFPAFTTALQNLAAAHTAIENQAQINELNQ